MAQHIGGYGGPFQGKTNEARRVEALESIAASLARIADVLDESTEEIIGFGSDRRVIAVRSHAA